jgi:hypothetical protein
MFQNQKAAAGNKKQGHHQSDHEHEFDEDDDEVFRPPVRRKRKDSFRITQVCDSNPRISESRISESELEYITELDLLGSSEKTDEQNNRQQRVKSVDSGMIIIPTTSEQQQQHQMRLRTNSMDHPNVVKNHQSHAWKQLNEDLNHLFPTHSRRPSGSGGGLAVDNPNGLLIQITKPPLRKSASRSCIYEDFYEAPALDDPDDLHQSYHTIHGGRKNPLTASRNLEPFSKITRSRRNGVGDESHQFLHPDQGHYLPELTEKLSNASSITSVCSSLEPDHPGGGRQSRQHGPDGVRLLGLSNVSQIPIVQTKTHIQQILKKDSDGHKKAH